MEIKEFGEVAGQGWFDLVELLESHNILYSSPTGVYGEPVAYKFHLTYQVNNTLKLIKNGKISKITYNHLRGNEYYSYTEINPLKQKAQSHIPYSSKRHGHPQRNGATTWYVPKRGHRC